MKKLEHIRVLVQQLEHAKLPAFPIESLSSPLSVPPERRGSQATSLRQLHASLKARCDQLKALESSIATLWRDAFVCAMQPLALLSPISRLPAEILCEVF